MRHHLAILYRTFLNDILIGRKTVECRFSCVGVITYMELKPGDLIWLKQVSGPVRGTATVESLRYFDNLTPQMVDTICLDWNDQIRAPAAFWRTHRNAASAALIWLTDVRSLRPFSIQKKDRRAWVSLEGPPIPGQPIVGAKSKV